MRTSSIVINDQLIQTAMNLSGLKTKKEVVEKALELLIQMVNQEGIRTLRGKVKWEGDWHKMRADARQICR
ncbi:MAG: type II toxin-antitoxin system VapB family antitoxin [Saprospiraceae bacterium]|nr:type II toxin-antitoxin system VapB family antitoxin [Saprospiraceae bacterium]